MKGSNKSTEYRYSNVESLFNFICIPNQSILLKLLAYRPLANSLQFPLSRLKVSMINKITIFILF